MFRPFVQFDGRIRRMGWWIAGIGMALVSSIVDSIRDNDDVSFIVFLLFSIIAFIVWVAGISISVRRWHDMNKSGWWVLINIIPILGWIYSLIMLGFVSGDQGHNSYGPPPREGQIL